MKSPKTLISLFLSSMIVSALSPVLSLAATHAWSEGYSLGIVENGDEHFGVAANASGTVAITGDHLYSASLGGPVLGLVGISDVFVASYDLHGQHLWSRSVGSFSVDHGYDVAIDESGKVAIAGFHADTIDLGGGAIGSGGGGFVAVFDSDGNHLWSRANVGSNLVGVEFDSAGNVVAVGHFLGTIDLGGGDLTSNGFEDVLVVKYDTAGNYVSAHAYGQSFRDYASDVAISAFDEIVVTGDTSLEYAFILKLDSNLSNLWSYVHVSSSRLLGKAVAIDSLGNVFLGGDFSGWVDFGLGQLSSIGFSDVFLVKYTSAGTPEWSTSFGGAGYDQLYGLEVGPDDHLAATGWFGSTVDFGGGPVTAANGQDLFIAAYDGTGAYTWHHVVTETSDASGRGLAIDSQGDIILAAHYSGDVDMGGGFLGSGDLALAKFLIDTAALIPPIGGAPLVLNDRSLRVDGVTLSNQGSRLSRDFRCGYYLSPDSTITVDDDLLGSVEVTGIPADGEVSLPGVELALPTGIAQGIHFLGVLADDLNEVIEIDEADNFGSTGFDYFDVGNGLPCAYAQAYVGSFGGGVADMSGTFAAFGGTERVQLYRRTASNWQVADLITVGDGMPDDGFGTRVSMDGDRLAVLAPRHDAGGTDAGAVYCYQHDGNAWVLDEKVLPPAGASFVVKGLILSGDVLAVTKGTDGVLIYRRGPGGWSLEQDVSTVATGQGSPVDLDGDVLVVGSGFEGVEFSGRVRIYRFDGSSWALEQTLSASTPVFSDAFGHSVAVSGDRLVVAVPAGGTSGSTHVFERPGATWVETAEFPGPAWNVDLDGPDIVTMNSNIFGVRAEHHHLEGTTWQTTTLDALTHEGSVGLGPIVDQGSALIPNLSSALFHVVELSTDCNQNGLGDLCEIQLDAALDGDGNGVLDECDPTAVVDEQTPRPVRSALHAAVPNPFNPVTSIAYSLHEPSQAEIAVFDLAGRRVRTLVDAFRPAGEHAVQWDGHDGAGGRVASGVYLYRLVAGEFSETKRMVLLK